MRAVGEFLAENDGLILNFGQSVQYAIQSPTGETIFVQASLMPVDEDVVLPRQLHLSEDRIVSIGTWRSRLHIWTNPPLFQGFVIIHELDYSGYRVH